MTDKMSHTPSVPSDKEPAGRWVEEDGRKTWKGPFESTEQRGQATIRHLFAKPRSVEGCLLPDGTRGSVSAMMTGSFRPNETTVWRRALADGSWRHGRVEFLDNEVRFIDVVTDKVARQPSPGIDLENDLHADTRIIDLVKDDEFATELYSALCNMDWVTVNGSNKNNPWSCSWRYSGGIVAELRDCGEEYMDFYCSGNEGYVSPRVQAELERIGWRPIVPDDCLFSKIGTPEQPE